jgi:hypothetical protein
MNDTLVLSLVSQCANWNRETSYGLSEEKYDHHDVIL